MIILEVKISLHQLFSQFGEIVKIIMKSNLKNKGQAFIVMNEINQSILAQKYLDKYLFLGKIIVSIQYKSQIILFYFRM